MSAQEQQEPMSRHEAFLRADWVDAFVPDLEFDRSRQCQHAGWLASVQATADYYLSRAWTVGGLAAFTFGERRSEYGSLPQTATILLRVVTGIL